MTHLVTDNCIKCKHTDCVDVCPVDCFYEGPDFLVINPDECIDCAVCIPECPVDAIVAEDEVPNDGVDWYKINAELSVKWADNLITQKVDPLPDHESWTDVPGKVQYLEKYLNDSPS